MNIGGEIRSIAEQYLSNIKSSGYDNIMATCPFHTRADGSAEKSPSFAMSLKNGLYLCHSCHAKGNLRSFLKNIGVSPSLIESIYKYALESAEEGAAPPPDPIRPKIALGLPIDERLLGLLDYCPTGMLQSGFTEDTLKYFEVGFDYWHNRITFPIRDLKGQLTAISGRAIYEDQEPRYKIYEKEYPHWGLPERIGWDKRSVLYHAHKVYPTTYFSPHPDPVIVVEGFKACAWVYQAGFKNVTALIGSYLSWEHKWTLERLGAPIYLFLDNNDAGRRGRDGAIKSLRGSLPTYVIEYPSRLVDDVDAQPDSCTAEEIIEQYHQAVPWYRLTNLGSSYP